MFSNQKILLIEGDVTYEDGDQPQIEIHEIGSWDDLFDYLRGHHGSYHLTEMLKLLSESKQGQQDLQQLGWKPPEDRDKFKFGESFLIYEQDTYNSNVVSAFDPNKPGYNQMTGLASGKAFLVRKVDLASMKESYPQFTTALAKAKVAHANRAKAQKEAAKKKAEKKAQREIEKAKKILAKAEEQAKALQ